MALYAHQRSDWPAFRWDTAAVLTPLAALRYKQGRLVGQLESLGFPLQLEAEVDTLTLDLLTSHEIEGELLPLDTVRSSIARRLGVDKEGLLPADRAIEGLVDVLLDATRQYASPLTAERLFNWHAALFPTGRSGMFPITVAGWRTPENGPMQVVSGPMGRERVHFQAPEATRLPTEMAVFMAWFNQESDLDPILKSAIAHLWFITLHPFDDGNGRIARTMADMQLAKADGSPHRFYSMSAQISRERDAYYTQLERTQRADLTITDWLLWFLDCLDRALTASSVTVEKVILKARYWTALANVSLSDRQRYMVGKLLDGFTGKLTTSKWAKLTKTSQDTALRDIQALVKLGVLIQEPAGGRSTSYLLAVLDA